MAACTTTIRVFLGRPLFLLSSGNHSIINFGEKLLVSIGRLPSWGIGGRSPDMVGTGEIKYLEWKKLALLPGSLILIYQWLEEENLDQISPAPPGLGLMQRAISSRMVKRQEILKNQTPSS
jgi:hypothetical protein